LGLFLLEDVQVLFGEGGLADGGPGCIEELLLLDVLGRDKSLIIREDVSSEVV
jgi:hypothetical protein